MNNCLYVLSFGNVQVVTLAALKFLKWYQNIDYLRTGIIKIQCKVEVIDEFLRYIFLVKFYRIYFFLVLW